MKFEVFIQINVNFSGVSGQFAPGQYLQDGRTDTGIGISHAIFIGLNLIFMDRQQRIYTLLQSCFNLDIYRA